MLDHVKNMRKPRTPAEDQPHQNGWQPVGFIPKAEKPNQPNADGGKTQLHLEAAV